MSTPVEMPSRENVAASTSVGLLRVGQGLAPRC